MPPDGNKHKNGGTIGTAALALTGCHKKRDTQPLPLDQCKSKRSRVITLLQAATKSFTNWALASSAA